MKPLLDKPKITVLICTLNEAENLPHVLRRILRWVGEVLLVDGHSTDGTVHVAQNCVPVSGRPISRTRVKIMPLDMVFSRPQGILLPRMLTARRTRQSASASWGPLIKGMALLENTGLWPRLELSGITLNME